MCLLAIQIYIPWKSLSLSLWTIFKNSGCLVLLLFLLLLLLCCKCSLYILNTSVLLDMCCLSNHTAYAGLTYIKVTISVISNSLWEFCLTWKSKERHGWSLSN